MSYIYSQAIAVEIAKELLKVKAVKVQPTKPFTWASGIISPIYCDNRKALSKYDARMKIAVSFAHILRDKFPMQFNHEELPEKTRIAGVATAGIGHGMNVANEFKANFCYVREKPKGHGLQNQIEGFLNRNDDVVVIEDLISTGGSSKRVIEAILNEGANITALGAIVTYNLSEADKAFAGEDYPVFALTDYDTIIQVAADEDYIQQDQLALLSEWKKDPQNWKPTY